MKLNGRCYFCNREGTQTILKNHFSKCVPYQKSLEQGENIYYMLRIEDSFNPDYWLFINMKSTSKLSSLDGFLRKIWLECCNHTSQFSFSESGYPIPFSRKIDQVFLLDSDKILKTKLHYKYDFDNPTTLTINPMSIFKSIYHKKNIMLMARNILHEFKCSCQKQAEFICTKCQYGNKNPFLCKECASTHKCGTEALLPVVNSPRMGICKYDGKKDIWS